MQNRHAAGFTLIELVATMVLTAMVGTAFAMALAYGVNQYAESSRTATLTQKARLALTRMFIELVEIQGVDGAQQGNIDDNAFYYIDHDGNAGSLAKSGTTLVMNGQFTLVDGVGSYSGSQKLFTYLDADGNAWTPSDGFDDLFEIAILLKLSTPDGGDISFTHSVNPRKSTIPNAPKME